MRHRFISSFIYCLIFALSVHAEERLVIPQSVLDQIDQGNAEMAYYVATQFDKRRFDESNIDIKNDNDEKAQQWMKKAAEMQYPQAMFEWAMMLEYNEKEAEALDWLQKAAKLNMSDAIEKIAFYHLQGFGGLSRNCKVAYEWYEKAEVYEHKLAYNDHAWSLATSAYKVCRSPEKALLLISKLMSLYKQEDVFVPNAVLDTKAAVHAGVSDFNKAIEIQKQAIEMLGEGNAKLESYQERLNSYQLRKAWIQRKMM